MSLKITLVGNFRYNWTKNYHFVPNFDSKVPYLTRFSKNEGVSYLEFPQWKSLYTV